MAVKIKRIVLSVLCGFIILVITWKYQNYDYTLKLEDEFFKKVFLFKDKIYSQPPKNKPAFIFINTGKDLALIEDSIDYGNVAVSDREKIHQLLYQVNRMEKRPVYSVVDIQFYYPFTANTQVDSMMQLEIAKNRNLVIPILKDAYGNYKTPLYRSDYAHSDYRTFGASFNKFRVMLGGDIKSIPLLMHEKINGAKYRDDFMYPNCNGRLCLSAIWPSYYIKDADLKKSTSITNIEEIQQTRRPVSNAAIRTEYYNIGELLFDMEANPANYTNAFENKIMIIGNFQEDVHVTPVGRISGPVLLANIYLSLLNNQHIVSGWLLLLMLVSFSALSYVAIFKKMPEINLSFKFLFSSHLTKFIKNYISYFGAMFVVSLIALIFFEVQIALFLPSAIFSGIEWLKEKKYKDLKN